MTKGGTFFIYGGDQKTPFVLHHNFVAVITGASGSEIQELESALFDIISSFRAKFTERDCHAVIVGEILGRYIKEILEGMNIPQALSAEAMFVDANDRLIIVTFLGNCSSVVLARTKSKFFTIGCDAKTKEFMEREFRAFFKSRTINTKSMNAFIDLLKKKMHLRSISFFQLEG